MNLLKFNNMITEVTTERNLLFKEKVYLTQVKEYGISWEKFASGEVIVPPEGLRFDIHFEGDVFGEQVNGTISGIDYLTVRADGRFILDLYATITTSDGASISVKENGINAGGNLRLSMNFHTKDESQAGLGNWHCEFCHR
jgi:hypothetical protein